MQKRVLVTGGAGFIGSHIVDAFLKLGYSATVLDNFSSGSEKNLRTASDLAKQKGLGLEIVRASVDDPAVWSMLKEHYVVCHLAAQTSVTASVKDPHNDFRTNVFTVLPILDYIQRVGVKTFLYANTAGALYGEAFRHPTDEDHPVRPMAPYGATKSFTETYLGSWTRSMKGTGVFSSNPQDKNYFTWASLRLGNVYGPRQISKGEAGVMPIFLEILLSGKAPTIFGDGSKTRDYVFVEDVVASFVACFRLAQNTSIDDYFNVASGVETSDERVLNEVVSSLKKHVPTQNFARPNFEPVRPGEVHKSCLAISKLQSRTEWAPKWDFSKGVAVTTEAYLKAMTEK